MLAPSQTSVTKNTIYAGSVLFNIGYGCYLLVSISSISALWRRPARTPARRVLLPYTVVMLVLNTTFTVLMNVYTNNRIEELYNVRHDPDMAEQSLLFEYCGDGTVIMQVLRTLPILLNDLLFLYRGVRILEYRWRTLAAPSVLYAALLLLGVLQNIGCYHIPGLYHSDRFFYAFLGLSIVLNLLLTALIWTRLRSHRNLILRAMNGDHAGEPYSPLITIVVESAAGWTVGALLYLVTLASGAWISDFFEYTFQIAVQVSPAVLIYRIAINKQYATPEELRTLEKLTAHAVNSVDVFEHQCSQSQEDWDYGRGGAGTMSAAPPSVLTTRSVVSRSVLLHTADIRESWHGDLESLQEKDKE